MQDILLQNQYFFYKTFDRVHDFFSVEVELVFQFTIIFLLFLSWTHLSQSDWVRCGNKCIDKNTYQLVLDSQEDVSSAHNFKLITASIKHFSLFFTQPDGTHVHCALTLQHTDECRELPVGLVTFRIYFDLRNLFFEQLEKMGHIYRQDIPIQSPCQRLKNGIS